MYGLMIESLDDERRRAEVGEALGQVGFECVTSGIYICTKPRRTELLAVHDAVEALHNLPWISETATKVIAIRIDEMGDITAALE